MDQKPDDKSTETLEDPSTKPLTPAAGATPESASPTDEGESLESDTSSSETEVVAAAPKKTKQPLVQRVIAKLNIYLLLFIFILVLASGVVFVGIQKNKKAATTTTLTTQELSADQLNKITATDATVGDAKQTLTIQSNAIFNDALLVKGTVDVAGTVKLGGNLSAAGLTVTGNALFDQLSANKVSVAGDTNIQGQVVIQKGLTVTGGASFGAPISAPQLTIQSLQLNSDLQFNKHLDAGGPSPSAVAGSGLGGGGTTSVNGTDTAGTIVINFGSGATATACYISITFSSRFPDAPHVVVGATSADAAQLQYYVSRTDKGFQLCSAGGSASGAASFDYLVID